MAGANAEQPTDVDPMQDADAWQALPRETQSDILDEGLADLRGEKGSGAFRHLDEDDQAATVDAIERDPTPAAASDGGELSETERAMQAALEETWTAEVFADLEDVPTVPFECRELTSEEQDIIMDAGRLVMALQEDVEDEGDLDDVEASSEHFDSAADLDGWLSAFLADVTVDDAFDEQRFRTGRGMRSNTRKLLFTRVFLRYREETERAVKFRTE